MHERRLPSVLRPAVPCTAGLAARAPTARRRDARSRRRGHPGASRVGGARCWPTWRTTMRTWPPATAGARRSGRRAPGSSRRREDAPTWHPSSTRSTGPWTRRPRRSSARMTRGPARSSRRRPAPLDAGRRAGALRRFSDCIADLSGRYGDLDRDRRERRGRARGPLRRGGRRGRPVRPGVPAIGGRD